MTDMDRFETRVASWIEARADLASRPFDAANLAHRAVATSGHERRWSQRRAWRPPMRFHATLTMFTLAAAAVAVLAVGIAGHWLATGPAAVGDDPSPTPAASPTEPPPLLPLSYGRIDPGTYALGSPLSAPDSPIARMTATVPEGWAGTRGMTFAFLFQLSDDGAGHVNLYLPHNFFVDGCDGTAGRWDPPLGPSVDDFVTALVGVEGYQTTDPEDVTVLGYPGKYVEQVTPSSVARCTDGHSCIWETQANETAACYGANGRVRLWILDIEGERMVIELPDDDVAPAPTGTDPVSRAEQQQVFDSIRIAPAPSPSVPPSASAAS